MKKYIAVALVLLFAAFLLGLPALAAGGTGTGDALLPIGVAQTVPAQSTQWYYFDVGGGKAAVTATLDDNGAAGIRLALYTPTQIAAWQAGEPLTPIGVGSPFVGHDLGWAGVFNAAGRYYAVVSNDSSVPVTVSLRVVGDAVTTSVNTTPTPTPLVNPFATVTPLGKGFSGRLAFVNQAGGTVYVVNGDGTGLQAVSYGLDPQWNHAGTQLALAREGPVAGIFAVQADGSNDRLLFERQQVRAPDWSPDDGTILFSYQGPVKESKFCFRGRCFTFGQDVLWKLATVSAAGGGYTDVPSTPHAFTPSWNPDGVTFIYNDPALAILQARRDHAYDPFPLIGDLRPTSPGYNPLRLMSEQYAPDGKRIVYMVYQQPVWEIAVAQADGTNQHLVTQQNPLDFVHPNNFAPIWSPDGKQILFLSDRNGKVEFFLMQADGTNQVQVLKNVTDQVPLSYEYESERMMSWTR